MLAASSATSAAAWCAPRIAVRDPKVLAGAHRGAHRRWGSRTRAADPPDDAPRRRGDPELTKRLGGDYAAAGITVDLDDEDAKMPSSIERASSAEEGASERDAPSPTSSSPSFTNNPFAEWTRRLTRAVVSDDAPGVSFRVASAAELASSLADARALLSTDIAGEMARAIENTAASRADIGWLTRSESMKEVTDGTPRFETILNTVRVHDESVDRTLTPNSAAFGPGSPAYLLVPGLYGSYYPGYLWDVRDHFTDRGGVCRISAEIDGEGTVSDNARAIVEEITRWRRGTLGESRTVVLVGHSKGGVDAAAACALYKKELAGIVRGIVVTQCPYGGSPVATDLLGTKALEGLTATALERVTRSGRGGGRALVRPMRDLTYKSRMKFLAERPLDARAFPTVSFHTETTSRASLMYLPAAYTRGRYGAASDGLVARCDAEVPGSVCVRWKEEQDHSDCVYPRAVTDETVSAHRTWLRATRLERLESVRDANGLVPLAVARDEIKRREGKDVDGEGNERGWAAGEALVRARATLDRALPERLGGIATPGEYHEALVTLLLEQPWDPHGTRKRQSEAVIYRFD